MAAINQEIKIEIDAALRDAINTMQHRQRRILKRCNRAIRAGRAIDQAELLTADDFRALAAADFARRIKKLIKKPIPIAADTTPPERHPGPDWPHTPAEAAAFEYGWEDEYNRAPDHLPSDPMTRAAYLDGRATARAQAIALKK